ncbi:MAG: HYR domain-containing protein [Thermoleophilia bacterium]|nr:HYR domain-containing protein [Thermoleophilia bacterium]
MQAGDQTAPAITTPGDLVHEANSSSGADVTFDVTASDDVDGTVGVVCDPASGSTFPIGDTVVTCTAQDAAGNEAQALFTVTIQDSTPPTLALPATITVDAPDANGATVTYTVDATDAVSGTVDVSCDHPSGSLFTIGTTIVTCEAQDAAGNTASSSFMIVVLDVTPPTIEYTGPATIEVTSESGEPVDFAVDAVDDVDGALTSTCDPASGSVLAPGSYHVTCSAEDSQGNSASVEFDVEVVFVNAFTRAQDRIEQFLPEVLESRYQSGLGMGVLVDATNEHTVVMDVVDSAGATKRIWSKGNFYARNAQGQLAAIDTTLVSVAGGFAPANVSYDATFPTRHADGIRWTLPNGHGEVRAVPEDVNANAPDGQVLDSYPDRVLYPSAWPHADVLDIAMGSGVKEFAIATSPDAPTSLSWQLQLPVGAVLDTTDSGLDVLLAGGDRIELGGLPRAHDADGMIVPAWYEANGSQLTLHWTPIVDDGSGAAAAAFPVAIDPSFYYTPNPVPETTDTSDASTTSDGNGIGATCESDRFRINFAGTGTGRTFYGTTTSFASAACLMGGPPPGADWWSLFGTFEWEMSNYQSVRLTDSIGESPTLASGTSMGDFTRSAGGTQTGSTTISWNDAHNGPPEGGVRWQMRQTATEILPAGSSRGAFFDPMTRSFIDETEPTLVSIAPDVDGMIVQGGVRTISISAIDDGYGCTGGGGHVDVTSEGADTPEASWPVVNCQFAVAYDFAPATQYSIEYFVADGLNNPDTTLEETIEFDTADPILDPDPIDGTVGGKYDVFLQVAEDLEPGTAQLWGTSQATGATFAIGAPVGLGETDFVWDTTPLQNGEYTLQLLFTPGSGPMRVLETTNVEIATTKPMMTSSLANAAQTDVGAGLSVLHGTGALNATFTDVSQTGSGGVQFGVGRSYNSQDLVGGVLGQGWRMSFEQRLVTGPDLVVTYEDATGRQWPFVPKAGGGFDPAPGQVGQLRSNPDPLTAVDEPYQITFPDARTLSFGADGRLVRESWPNGTAIHYSAPAPTTDGGYDVVISDDASHLVRTHVGANNRVAWVDDSLGRRTTYSYDSQLRLTAVTNPEGDTPQTYTYAAFPQSQFDLRQGAVIDSVTTPRGVLHFDTTERLTDFDEGFAETTLVLDESSKQRTFNFEGDTSDVETTFEGRTEGTDLDELGQEIGHVDPAGEERFTDYNDRGQVEYTENELGDTTEATYDPATGVLLSEIDEDGNETTYSQYDALGNAHAVTDAEGNTTTSTYDAYGRKLTETTPLNETTEWTYVGTSRQPAVMNPPVGATIHYTYSDTGQVQDKYWVDTDSQTHHLERATFDAAGQQLSTQTGELAATTYEYDAAGRQVAVVDGAGNRSETQYTPDGLVSKTIDAGGNERSTTYDEQGRPSVEVDPLGNTRISHYDAFGNVVESIDERGNMTTTTYDAVDNPTSETDPLNRTTMFDYDAVGNEVSETDPAGNVTQTSYDGVGNEIGTVEPGGFTTSTSFTQLDNPRIETNQRGYSTTYGYDALGRETSVTNAENETTRTGYDAAGRVDWVENANAERTSYTLDPAGNIVRTDNPDGTYNLAEWDDAGLQVSRTDERGLTTDLSHDELGRVTAEQRPDGTVVAYTYDWAGRKISETDPAGNVTSWDYDELGRTSSVTYPDGRSISYSYDAAGNLVEMTDSTTGATTYEYDAANQRTAMVNAVGDRTEYVYNSRGLLDHESTDAKTTSYEYDARGNLTTVTSGTSVSTYTHDPNGNVLVHTLPDGSTITYTYDKVDRKIGEVHSLRGETTWTWDAASHVKTETTSAGTTTYVYDPNGRVESITYPGNMVVSFAYDEAGNILSITDWTGIRTFTHDAGGRVVQFTTMQGKPGSYTYDTAGRVIAMTYVNLKNQTINQAWVYDNQGRVISMNTGYGTITYEYWDNSSRLKTKTTFDGVVERYSYDSLGRLSEQSIDGRSTDTYHYDSESRIVLIEHTDATTGETYPLHRYTYTAAGQLASWEFMRDWYHTDFTYDSKGNLYEMYRTLNAAPTGTNTTSQDAGLAQCYQPDGMLSCSSYGNDIAALASAVAPPTDPTTFSGTRAAAARYMVSHPMRIRHFEHDSQGRVTERFIWNYTDSYTSTGVNWEFDARGNQYDSSTGDHLECNWMDQPDHRGTDTSVVWSHDGKLAAINHPASTGWTSTTYDYAPDGKLLGYLIGTNMQDLAWDGQGLAAVAINTATIFPYFNHRGDVITYHNRPGTQYPVNYVDYRYTPWGELDNNSQWVSGRNKPLFGGRDGAVPLDLHVNTVDQDYWMGARTYNAIQGRFRQIDPLPGQDGLTDTAYSYAASDPINRVDPTGMSSRAAGPIVSFLERDDSGKCTTTYEGKRIGSTRRKIEAKLKLSCTYGWPLGAAISAGTASAKMCLKEEVVTLGGMRVWKRCSKKSGKKRAPLGGTIHFDYKFRRVRACNPIGYYTYSGSSSGEHGWTYYTAVDTGTGVVVRPHSYSTSESSSHKVKMGYPCS